MDINVTIKAEVTITNARGEELAAFKFVRGGDRAQDEDDEDEPGIYNPVEDEGEDLSAEAERYLASKAARLKSILSEMEDG